MRRALYAYGLAGLTALIAVTACQPEIKSGRKASCDAAPTRSLAARAGSLALRDRDDPIALAEYFAEASREFGVPVEVLQAIAYVETQWHSSVPHDDENASTFAPSHMRVFGVMGLKSDLVFGDTLGKAAELVALEREEAATVPRANIRAGAALIRSFQRDENASQSDPAAWYEAIKAYSSMAEDADAESYLMDVYRVMSEGVTGNGIEILRRPGLPRPAVHSPIPDLESLLNQSQVSSGDMPPVIWDPSPNFTRNGLPNPRYIIVHVTQGSFSGAVSWLKDRASSASAHYVIRSADGLIKQLVKDTDRAWHARCWNSSAIGIEHEGFIAQPSKYFTDAMYSTSARLARGLAEKYGIPKTNIRIIGHDAGDKSFFPQTGLSDCNDHGDPGVGWDWSGYLRRVSAGAAPTPTATPTPIPTPTPTPTPTSKPNPTPTATPRPTLTPTPTPEATPQPTPVPGGGSCRPISGSGSVANYCCTEATNREYFLSGSSPLCRSEDLVQKPAQRCELADGPTAGATWSCSSPPPAFDESPADSC